MTGDKLLEVNHVRAINVLMNDPAWVPSSSRVVSDTGFSYHHELSMQISAAAQLRLGSKANPDLPSARVFVNKSDGFAIIAFAAPPASEPSFLATAGGLSFAELYTGYFAAEAVKLQRQSFGEIAGSELVFTGALEAGHYANIAGDIFSLPAITLNSPNFVGRSSELYERLSGEGIAGLQYSSNRAGRAWLWQNSNAGDPILNNSHPEIYPDLDLIGPNAANGTAVYDTRLSTLSKLEDPGLGLGEGLDTTFDIVSALWSVEGRTAREFAGRGIDVLGPLDGLLKVLDVKPSELLGQWAYQDISSIPVGGHLRFSAEGRVEHVFSQSEVESVLQQARRDSRLIGMDQYVLEAAREKAIGGFLVGDNYSFQALTSDYGATGKAILQEFSSYRQFNPAMFNAAFVHVAPATRDAVRHESVVAVVGLLTERLIKQYKLEPTVEFVRFIYEETAKYLIQFPQNVHRFNSLSPTDQEAIFGRVIDRGTYKVGNYIPTCFSENSRILMIDGSEKPIAELRPGDRVASFDPREWDGELVASTVVRTFKSKAVDTLGAGALVTAVHDE